MVSVEALGHLRRPLVPWQNETRTLSHHLLADFLGAMLVVFAAHRLESFGIGYKSAPWPCSERLDISLQWSDCSRQSPWYETCEECWHNTDIAIRLDPPKWAYCGLEHCCEYLQPLIAKRSCIYNFKSKKGELSKNRTVARQQSTKDLDWLRPEQTPVGSTTGYVETKR